MDYGAHSGTFTYKAVVEGIRAEFQIMSMASMNMKDPEGSTRPIMATFFMDAWIIRSRSLRAGSK